MWQDIILKKFNNCYSNIIIVADNDEIIKDAVIAKELSSIGEIHQYISDIKAIELIEKKYKPAWKSGIKSKLIILLSDERKLISVIENQADKININSREIFSHLDYLTLKGLDVSYFNQLYPAYLNIMQQSPGRNFSENETSDFILRALWSIDTVNLTSFEKIIYFLIEKNLNNYSIPDKLSQYLGKNIKKLPESINIEEFLNNNKVFLSWLNEEWNSYVFDIVNGKSPKIDFSSNNIPFLIDNVFQENLISKISLLTLRKTFKMDQIELLFQNFSWVAAGIDFDDTENKILDSLISEENLDNEIVLLNELLAKEEISPNEWLDIGAKWGNLIYESRNFPNIREKIDLLDENIDGRFKNFILSSYSSLFLRSTETNTITLNKVLPHITFNNDIKSNKIALIVIDCLGMDQWPIFKEYLNKDNKYIFKERKCYAMLPTLTSYSRQAIFSGEAPSEFPEYVNNTSKENKLFYEYCYREHNLTNNEVFYSYIPKQKFYFEGDLNAKLYELKEAIDSSKKIIACVLGFVDDLAHGSSVLSKNKNLFYEQVSSYLKESNFQELISYFIAKDYIIYLTSDHGNIVAEGIDIKEKKDFLETYGKRCLIYDDKQLALNKAKEGDITIFNNQYLPVNQTILFPNHRYMFDNKSKIEITHGGISLEEVIVPFIEVRK